MEDEKLIKIKNWHEYAKDVRDTAKAFCYQIGIPMSLVSTYNGFTEKIVSRLFKYCTEKPNMNIITDYINGSIAYYVNVYHLDGNALRCIADIAIRIKCNHENADAVLEDEINKYYQSLGKKDDSL